MFGGWFAKTLQDCFPPLTSVTLVDTAAGEIWQHMTGLRHLTWTLSHNFIRTQNVNTMFDHKPAQTPLRNGLLQLMLYCHRLESLTATALFSNDIDFHNLIFSLMMIERLPALARLHLDVIVPVLQNEFGLALQAGSEKLRVFRPSLKFTFSVTHIDTIRAQMIEREQQELKKQPEQFKERERDEEGQRELERQRQRQRERAADDVRSLSSALSSLSNFAAGYAFAKR